MLDFGIEMLPLSISLFTYLLLNLMQIAADDKRWQVKKEQGNTGRN